MGDDENTSRIRGADWIFNALWTACGDSQIPRCAVRIPTTFIFREGVPIKALQTNLSGGYVERLSVDSKAPVERHSGEKGFHGESLSKLRFFRKAVIDYCKENEYDVVQDNITDPIICRVSYTDGEFEELTLSALDSLTRSDTWRLQVLIIQGYVPPTSSQDGHYTDKAKVRSKLLTQGAEATNQLTRALALYAERAYTSSESAVLGVDSYAAATRVIVKELHANFVYDHHDHVVFLGTQYLTIAIVGNRRAMEDYLADEKRAREMTAARSVAEELRQLMQHAKRRGLTPEQSFAHFDVDGLGFIDLTMLISGVAKLGIGITNPVAELLLQIMGGVGSNFLTNRDFESFINEADLDVFEGSSEKPPGSADGIKAKRVRSVASVQTNRDVRQGQRKQQQIFSQSQSVESFPSYDIDPSISSAKSRSGKKSKKHMPASNGPLQLPVAEEAYTVNAPKSSATDLPPWASKRQKRALKELQRTHESWNKKKMDDAMDDGYDPIGDASVGSMDGLEIDADDAIMQPPTPIRPSPMRNGSPQRPLHSTGGVVGDRATSSKDGLRSTSAEGNKKSASLKELSIEMSLQSDIRTCPDDMLHVDHGVMMTYRVLKGRGSNEALKTHEENRALKYRSILELREKNLREKCREPEAVDLYGELSTKHLNLDGVEREGQEKKWISFTIVVVPDIFMCLQTMEKYLSPILLKYPLARLVLVGLPGLPYTHWPRGWVLNIDLHARSIGALLQHLKTSGNPNQWSPVPDEPVVFMAFGSGVHSLSRFVSSTLSSMPWLESNVHGMINVNGFSKMTKNYKRVCKELRESMLTATSPEISELVASLHFWDEYLSREGREKVMNEFWSTRKGLVDKSKLFFSTHQEHEVGGLGYTGVLEQLRGLLIGPNDPELQASFLYTRIPLLVIQCTEDVFVEPHFAGLIYTDSNLAAYNRKLITDMKDFLNPGSVMVNWLRGGHEAIQERSSFMLASLSTIAQLLGISPENKGPSTGEEFVNPYDNDVDIETLMKLKKESSASGGVADGDISVDEEKKGEAIGKALNLWQTKVERDDVDDVEEIVATASKPLDTPSEPQKDSVEEDTNEKFVRSAEDEEKIARKQREKEARKVAIQERRRRESLAAREAEVAALQEKQRKLRERKHEAKEMQMMAKEDERSLFAEEYWYEVEQQKKNAAIAKLRAEELFHARREEAVKKVEDQMAIDRALRLEERRKKAEAIAKQIEAEELQMEGEKEGGYHATEEDGPNAMIAATQRLLKDITECKQKLMESMKRQQLVEQKTLQYRNQKYLLEAEIRKLRQAIQLISKDKLMAGMGISRNETNELQKNLGNKEDTFREFCMVGKVREDQLAAANRSVQMLKVALQEREDLMQEKINMLEDYENRLSKGIRQYKLDLEHHVMEKDNLRTKRVFHDERVKNLSVERARLKNHKAEFVDSDVLIPGLLQRCVTRDLRKHLKKEYDKEKAKCIEIDERVEKLNEDIEITATKQERIIRDGAKISLALRVFHKVVAHVKKFSVTDVLTDLLKKTAAASVAESRRSAETYRAASIIGNSTPAERLRTKDSELRTKEERKFIAIDMVLNPNEYNHLTTTELEEMKFDPDYQVDLEITDLERILKLPEQIALALPFLSTLDEVDAHRLMNMFYRGKGDSFYKRADYMSSEPVEQSDDMSVSSMGESVASIYLSPDELREAEAIHDILVKEIKRDRVRSLTAGDDISDEERLWMATDRVLSPYMYAGAVVESMRSAESYTVSGRGDGNDLRFAVLPKNNHDHPQDGDKYVEMRWRYENGEVVFESDDFKCPYSRDQLLAIRSKSFNDLDDNEKRFRNVMDKYYVHEDESLYGHTRLQSMKEMSREIAKFVSRQDELDPDRVEPVIRMQYSDDTVEEDDEDVSIKRVYGSWEVVHPASASTESQNSYFQMSTFSCTRDHPASYAMRETDLGDNPFDIFSSILDKEDEEENEKKDPIEQGVSTILSIPGRRKNAKKKLGNSKYLIVDSPKILAQQDPKMVSGKITLITNPQHLQLCEINDQELAARQSRSHRFDIPEKDESRVLEFAVTILFQGTFGTRGYRLGRIAAGLFRLPDTDRSGGVKASALPVPTGYAPYDLQCPNLPDQMGRIVIVHKPKSRPIPAGSYQIVLGAASTTKYSIEVSCRYAQSALGVVDPLVAQAKGWQTRLPICLKELEDLDMGLRLAERKMLVTRKLIVEAEAETRRCQKGISILTEKLAKDDETMEFTEDERRDLMKEQGILEVEFAQWANTYASRNREKDDINEGIAMMHRLQREKQDEKAKLKADLTDARRDLPACIALLRSYQEAANVAISLNTTVQGKGATVASNTFSTGANTAGRIQTPADIVRRRYRREGWDSLSLEEQQWTILDQAMVPHKYEWIKEKEEEENFRRMEMGKKPKKQKKYNSAIEQYRMNKVEIGRIMAQPFAMLTRKEMNVRKLLVKFHDDADLIRRNKKQAVFNFDPKRAERTRGKQYAVMTKEEKEWSSIDKILHPEVWAYYHHDDDAKAWLDAKGKKAALDGGATAVGGGSITSRAATAHSRGITGGAISSAGSKTSASEQMSAAMSMSRGGSVSRDGSVSRGGDAISQSNSQDRVQNGSDSANISRVHSEHGSVNSGHEKKRQVSGETGQDLVESLARVLGGHQDMVMNEAEHRKGSVNLDDIIGDVHKTIQRDGKKKVEETGIWKNRFTKEKLIKIWKQTNPTLLENNEERYAYRLMQKYNGSYGAYMETALEYQKRKKNDTKMGAHVKWDVHGVTADPDVDNRAREVQIELDRAIANPNFWMDSLVLHTNDQRFPTAVLRLQLEEELDTILADQVRERERVDRMSAAQKGQDDETDDEASSEDSDDGDAAAEGLTMSKVQARAARRDRRRLKLKKDTLKDEVLVARKVILERNKTGGALDEAVIMNELGVSGCLACRAMKCQWEPTVDEQACEARKKELHGEIERVRNDPESLVWYSDVALSAQLGGNTVFEREDLFNELTYEMREIDRRLHLNNIDKELHDAFASRAEYVEVKHLHGYSTVLWTNNARKALGARQERLVAMNVAHEIIDDILEHMLEGWHFGERESKFQLAGFVPSVKKDGFMRAGQEQVQSVGIAIEKAKKRRDEKYKGIVSFEAMRGELEEKLMPIEATSKARIEDKRIAKEGTDHYHRLNEIETTLKFGLFMLTFMYFRAMAFLSREKKSWGGDDDPVNSGNKTQELTEERKKMLEEDAKLAARQKKMDLVLARAKEGEVRKRDREARERREAIQKLQEIVRRQRREKECINRIQRVYRGHLGRKAARRWAMKRAELSAINALMNAAATCLQRVWRGYLARVEAIETRAEMAYFIALMRAQEAAQDEEEYWETHNWQRYKRNAREFVNEQFRNEHAIKTLGAPDLGADQFDDDDDD